MENQNVVRIAIKNDQGKWMSAIKFDTSLCDDIITNKRSLPNIIIEERDIETAALLEGEFDAYAYCSQKRFNEEEAAYFFDEVGQLNNENNPTVIYYGVTPEAVTPSRIAIIAPDANITVTGFYCRIDQIDMIDLASFMSVQYEQDREERKKVFN